MRFLCAVLTAHRGIDEGSSGKPSGPMDKYMRPGPKSLNDPFYTSGHMQLRSGRSSPEPPASRVLREAAQLRAKVQSSLSTARQAPFVEDEKSNL